MLTVNLLGLDVPYDRPLFVIALVMHVVGVTAALTGALAATARKRPGWRPRVGSFRSYSLSAIFLTATVMAVLRWRHAWNPFVMATAAAGLGGFGWLARHRTEPGWMAWYGSAMGASYIVLLTGLHVDNGPQLPLWDRLPYLAYWLLPSVIVILLIIRALSRNGALLADKQQVSSGSTGVRR
jgi:hypothetical protein